MSILAELKRRNVVKVGVAYLIVAWLIAQVIDVVNEPLHLPDWFGTVVIVLLVIGFLLAIFLAWVFELTPEGIKVTSSEGPAQFHTQTTGQRLNFFITGVLVLVVAFLVVDKYVLEEDRTQNTEYRSEDSALEEQTIADVVQVAETDVLPNSVAVLPFENMSPDPADAYFASGLHEEILNQLVKLSKLNVISRTTMLQYADSSKTPPEIARELNVKSVMEGSVRYAGKMIKVTMQLIDPSTDLHLWSETYDGDMSDISQIFNIQADIAMNVANALAAEFSTQEQARIEEIPTNSPEAYTLYLSGWNAFRQGTVDGLSMALEKINSSVELDPDSAFLLSIKATINNYATIYFPERRDEYLATAEQSAQRAIEIDPDISLPHIAQAAIATNKGNWQKAHNEFRLAAEFGLPIQSYEPFAVFQFLVGRIEDSNKNMQRILKYDPLNFNVAAWELFILDIQTNTDAVLDKYDDGRKIFNMWTQGNRAVYFSLLGSGKIEEAMKYTSDSFPSHLKNIILENLNAPDKVLTGIRSFHNNNSYTDPASLAALAVALHDKHLALDISKNIPHIGAIVLWAPVFREMRKEQGFKEIVRALGLVDYWQEYDWPDLCKPLGEDDFECK